MEVEPSETVGAESESLNIPEMDELDSHVNGKHGLRKKKKT